ncbi:hypothetical protein NPIL_269451 [Nephila pilipes]|uniref:Uncharacterized protein n=1 Tax=Nephila pilipes TaxID=299642 RepID=A0A8X6QHQ9_NEPPI|nr:hypothetical protein NPIL_269451 [Nephila pilipes]
MDRGGVSGRPDEIYFLINGFGPGCAPIWINRARDFRARVHVTFKYYRLETDENAPRFFVVEIGLPDLWSVISDPWYFHFCRNVSIFPALGMGRIFSIDHNQELSFSPGRIVFPGLRKDDLLEGDDPHQHRNAQGRDGNGHQLRKLVFSILLL